MLMLDRKEGEALTIGKLKLKVVKVEQHRVKLVMTFPDNSIQHCSLPIKGCAWEPEPDIRIHCVKKIRRQTVQLGFDVPRHIHILRDNAKQRYPKIGEVVACG